VEFSGSFNELKELLLRYDTLSEVNAELIARLNFSHESFEMNKKRLQSKTEERSNQILNLNNEIASLSKYLDDLRLCTCKSESKIVQTLEKHSKTSLLIGKLKMSIFNLHDLVFDRRNCTSEFGAEFVKKLERVHQFITDLSEIVDLDTL
jgi:hypothetical protein